MPAALLLAGLLAVAAPTAQALCAVDEEGGCSRLQHSADLEVSGECADAKALCVVDKDGNFSAGPNDADWRVTVRNPTGSTITFELFAFGHYDDDGMPVRDGRVAPVLIATVEVAAGQVAVLEGLHVPGNVSYLRAQAMAADGRQAELEVELANFRIMMMQPGDSDGAPQDDGAGAPAGDHGSGSQKESPTLPLALLVAGVAAALVVARRLR